MKKLLLFIAFMAFALASFGQYTITDQGTAIKVESTSESIQFSKQDLIIQYILPKIYFISNDRLYTFVWTTIDSPDCPTIDSLYTVITGWLSTVTYASVTTDKLTADTITDGVATLTHGRWSGLDTIASSPLWTGAFTTTGLVTGKGLTFPDPGTSVNSDTLRMISDNSTTAQTGMLFTGYGADPYIRIAPPNSAGTAQAALDIHAESMTFFNGASDTNYVLTFNGKSHDGTITYMEDEDRFDFDNDVAVTGTLTGGTLTDGTLSITLGSITGGNLANFDTVTANYFSGTVIGGLYWSDTTAADGVGIATAFDISDVVNWSDSLATPGFLTTYSGLGYLEWTDSLDTPGYATTYSIADMVEFADTSTNIASQFDIADMLEWADTTAKIATDFELLSYVEWTDTTTNIATDFDIADMVTFSDTSTTIATANDLTAKINYSDTTSVIPSQWWVLDRITDSLSFIDVGWTILPGTPDTLYNNDSSLVKLNNWLMTDYITNCAVDDPFDGALGITNSKQTNVILGYLAGVNHPAMPRVGDSIVFSVFTGLAAGISADTISYSVFDGYGAGAWSGNVSYSVFDGYGAGNESSNVSNSVFDGSDAGAGSSDVSYSVFDGDVAGNESYNVSYSVFDGDGAGIRSSDVSYSVFDGYGAGAWSGNVSYSVFDGYGAGNESSNVSNSVFDGSDAGAGSSDVSYSVFDGDVAGNESYNVSYSVFDGDGAGIRSSDVSYSVFDGYGAGAWSSNVSNSVFDGDRAGYQADSVFKSGFFGNYSGATSNNISDVLFLGDSVGYGADGVHNQVWIDDSPTSTPLIRGYFAADSLVINGDLTATGNIQITGDGSPKFQFQVILDTLCSVRVGIDTVRLHPPR